MKRQDILFLLFAILLFNCEYSKSKDEGGMLMREPSEIEMKWDKFIINYGELNIRDFDHESCRLTINELSNHCVTFIKIQKHIDGVSYSKKVFCDNFQDSTKSGLISSDSLFMKEKDYDEINSIFLECNFYDLPSKIEGSQLDGTTYVLENNSKDGYHIVGGFFPLDGDFKKMCTAIATFSENVAN